MNNTATTRHEEIAALAHQIWKNRGNPSDQDLPIWLEAEQQVAAVEAHATPSDAKQPATKVPYQVEMTDPSIQLPLAASHQTNDAPTANADLNKLQKESARAPRVPTKTNTAKHSVPESGKPIWSKPHSS